MGQNPIQKEKLDKRNAEMSQLYPQLTYQEIGDKYNLSKERVRRIIIKVVQPDISGKVKINKK
jgi:DNA-directed RNA polymerase sigma subunit (sigma70/sigma32)